MWSILTGLGAKLPWLKSSLLIGAIGLLLAGIVMFLNARADNVLLKKEVATLSQERSRLIAEYETMQRQSQLDYQAVETQLKQAIKDNERLAATTRKIKGAKIDDAEKTVAPVLGIVLDDLDGLRK